MPPCPGGPAPPPLPDACRLRSVAAVTPPPVGSRMSAPFHAAFDLAAAADEDQNLHLIEDQNLHPPASVAAKAEYMAKADAGLLLAEGL